MFHTPADQKQLSKADSPLGVTAEREFFSPLQFKWIVTTLLVYFGLRLIFFATNIGPFVPPDEVTHFGISKIFAKVLFLPENSPETYEHGLVTNIPWLYYWIMGKLLPLNIFGIEDLLFLRLLNIPLAFGTIYFVWRTLLLLTDDRPTQTLLIVTMTNTLMFSFLSASVTYDNLLNLTAAMAIYYLLAFFKERSGNLLALSLICQLGGSLTKDTFLPLLLVLNVLLLIHEFRNIRYLPKALPVWLKAAGGQGAALVLAVLIALALNIQLYGGNFLRFHNLKPQMYEVVSSGAAMQNRTQARDLIFYLFKGGSISMERALQMANQIQISDRGDAIYLIRNYNAVLKGLGGEEQMLLPEYIRWWFVDTTKTIYGIKARQYMGASDPVLYSFFALLLLVAIAFIIRWRPKEEGAFLGASLAVIAGFYTLFILYFVSYKIYLDLKVFGVALTGRYLLPTIGAFYVVACHYLLRLFNNKSATMVLALLVALLFLYSDFPFFLLNATPKWFVASP